MLRLQLLGTMLRVMEVVMALLLVALLLLVRL